MSWRDIYNQISTSRGWLDNDNQTANNWITGISSNYRTYNPDNSKYASVAITRSSNFDPQKSFSNIAGSGRFSTVQHYMTNSSQLASATANRISYLTPSASRPKVYFWGQPYKYTDPIKAAFASQYTDSLDFYRFSDGDKVVMDQFQNNSIQWIWYNNTGFDNNLLTLSSSGTVSKIEGTTTWQDNTANPTTPLLFQTNGGMPADETATWRADYARDANWQVDDRDTYVIYRPNFGSNKQLPTDIETMGNWYSNRAGERSGSRNANELAPQWIISDIIFLQQEDVYTAWNL